MVSFNIPDGGLGNKYLNSPMNYKWKTLPLGRTSKIQLYEKNFASNAHFFIRNTKLCQ